MEFKNDKMGDYYVVSIAGRLDATTSGELEKQCDIWLSQGEHDIILDMGNLEYISSAGLRSILSSAKKLKKKGGNLHLCGLVGLVAEVLKMSGFAAIFQIFETREQAING